MPDEQLQPPQRALTDFLILSSLSVFLFFLIQLAAYYNDDAYITLRYARNLLQGRGLVWNPGLPVEGYSSFLWLMIISFLGNLQLDFVFASKLLGILFALLTLVLCFIFDQRKRFIAGLLLTSNSCFALWAVGGLETVAFGFFLFLGCTLFFKKSQTSPTFFPLGFIFCLATMTRPEGVLFFIITLLFILFKDKQLTPANVKSALLFAAGFSLVYLPYFVWRFYYYGHLFPCTFYVKGGTNSIKILFGSRYIFSFLIMYGFPLFMLLFVKDLKKFFRGHAYLISLFLSYGFYILMIGGDHMQGFRFIVPILPLMYLFVQDAFYESRFISKPVLFNMCLIVIVIINLFVSYRAIPQGPEQNQEAMSHSYKYRQCFKIPDPAAYLGKFVGSYIKHHWPPEATIAGNIAGSVPYFSDMKFIDMLGLNDYTIAQRDTSYVSGLPLGDLFDVKKIFTDRGRSEMTREVLKRFLPWQLIPGHGKGDGKYVLSREPDYIIIGPAEGDTKPWFLGDKEIISSSAFYDNYQFKQVSIKIEDKFHSYYQPTETGVLTFKYFEKKI